jgi:hypothetical protein
VMDGVNVFVEEFVDVHEPVEEVLPCVNNEPGHIFDISMSHK